jgi:GWxTD domain-containing protein
MSKFYTFKGMQRILFFGIIIFCLSHSHAQKKTVRAYFNTVQFYDPEIGNYLELHFQFDARSTKFKASKDGLQATVFLSIEIKDSIKTVFNDAYLLNSPLFIDSVVEDFYELRRIPLPPGIHQINLKIADQNNEKSMVQGSQLLEVLDLSKSFSVSQLEAIELAVPDTSAGIFQKNGFQMVPKINAYYGTQLSKIPFYYEIYRNTGTGQKRMFLEERLIDTEEQKEIYAYHQSYEIKDQDAVIPKLKTIDIAPLPSGSYAYEIALINEKDSIIQTSTYTFERGNFSADDTLDFHNVVMDPAFQASISDDSVHFYLGSILPITKAAENRNIRDLLKSKDIGSIRKYLQAFWLQTAPTDAYTAWIKYKQQVLYVQGLYKTNFQQGYETDRGRVYLQYGAPSTTNVKEGSPSEYPYEVWFYNKIGKFSNRRFIFYNPDLTNNAFRLLHSDLIGEVKNPGWSQVLSRRNTVNGTVDDPNLFNQRSWGQNSNDLFRQY